LPVIWHAAHSGVECPSVRGNDVWSKLAGCHPGFRVWQISHVTGKLDVEWFGFEAAM